ncbi:hypothetical protein [Asticcacaulis sp.]|uniref:hypothetical protein n=1 Tax=Asticcacaulis sp. TaxID=1872648 RepID=UPI00391B4172
MAFQNAQQWLLMGIRRASVSYASVLTLAIPKLLELAGREDIHALNRRHIFHCLDSLKAKTKGAGSEKIRKAIDVQPLGYVRDADWPDSVDATSGFSFDYMFEETEIDKLAKVFRLPRNVIVDAMASEIQRLWPDAQSFDYFEGRSRYRRARDDRYESFREHVQKHALLSAATTLLKTHPVAIDRYDVESRTDPWQTWLQEHDITFSDGLWLADRKDPIPLLAKERMLIPGAGKNEVLYPQEDLLKKLGFDLGRAVDVVPISGYWTSPDGVHVSITSALIGSRGAVGACAKFSKQTHHEVWLPEFFDGGYYNSRYRSKTVFEPFVWSPDAHGIGIDAGDEYSSVRAGARPRLGIPMTKRLKLTGSKYAGAWYTANDELALDSIVWGQWRPSEEERNSRSRHDGQVLYANTDWLEVALQDLGKRLAFKITFSKPSYSRSYDNRSGAKAVFVGLRGKAGEIRIWHAVRASRTV